MPENNETYIICCWCSKKFENTKDYRDHYNEMLAKGDNKHDNWFRLKKENKK